MQSAIRRLTTYGTDGARQAARALPGPARAGLRGLVERCDQLRPPTPIEGWSRPLINPGGGAKTNADLLLGTSSSPRDTGVIAPVAPPSPKDGASPGLRCLVVTALLDVGGMDEVVAFLARRLPEHGLQTAVLHATDTPSATGQPTGRLGRMLQSSGIEVREANAEQALDWIRQWRPDVITAHGAPGWVLTIAQQLDVPYVDNLHGMHTHFAADWGAEAARSTQVSAIVSVSELIRQQYLEGNPLFPANRIVTIPNGVDDQRRVTLDRAAVRARLGLTNEYVFVSLARHVQQKNSYGLMRAFAELARRRPGAHLVLAGKPEQRRYYRQMVRLRDELPCRHQIHLRDHAPSPAALLAAADGFVLDSFFEGWSLASMEALYAGLPVVLSEVGGAREQIGGDPERGFLVPNPLGDPLAVNWETLAGARYKPQANADELVAAMDRLIADRTLYLANRGKLADESAARFSAHGCLARHAATLSAVASGADISPVGTEISSL